MEKKRYEQPQTTVTNIEPSGVLCGSDKGKDELIKFATWNFWLNGDEYFGNGSWQDGGAL